MKQYIIFVLMIVFLYGCSEERHSHSTIEEIKTNQTNNNSKNIELSPTFSISEIIIDAINNQSFSIYKINQVHRPMDFYKTLFENLDKFSYPFTETTTPEGDILIKATNDVNHINILDVGYRIDISKHQSPTSLLWFSREVITLETQGILDLNQENVNLNKINEEKILVENFLKTYFNIQEANVLFIDVDEQMIAEFKEHYQQSELAKDHEEMNLLSIQPFTYFVVQPKINNINVFNDVIISETDNQNNSILGTNLEFIVQENYIKELFLMNIYDYQRTALKEVSLDKEQFIMQLKEIIKNRYSQENILFDNLKVIYMPVLNHEHQHYEFRPTLHLSTSVQTQIGIINIYMDLETLQEVIR